MPLPVFSCLILADFLQGSAWPPSLSGVHPEKLRVLCVFLVLEPTRCPGATLTEQPKHEISGITLARNGWDHTK